MKICTNRRKNESKKDRMEEKRAAPSHLIRRYILTFRTDVSCFVQQVFTRDPHVGEQSKPGENSNINKKDISSKSVLFSYPTL